MKLLILSDTHGNFPLACRAHSLSEPVDVIVHLGDGSDDADQLREALGVPVVNVAGNCDLGCCAPREQIWEYAGKKVLLTHGDAYGVKGGLERLEKRAGEAGADAVLFGHSHQAVLIIGPDLLMLNPGTLTHASSNKSYAVMSVTKDGITAQLFDID